MLLKTCLLFLSVHTNPFIIDFPPKKGLDYNDYERVQELLRQKTIEPTINGLYPLKWDIRYWFSKKRPYDKQDFINRCSRGFQQTIIDRAANLYPRLGLIEGEDAKNCIVLYASLNGLYPKMLLELIDVLHEMGYKGAIYYRIGGYPNPTGEEICYAGTPYAFKIFALKEALDLGFENVLWLDTAVWPLSSTQEVFEQIEKEGFFFDTGNPNPLSMLKTTRKMLENYCDKDLKKSRRVAGWIIGFNRDFKYLERFFNEYSKLVRLGTPFLSVNPEENVLTAILLKLDIPLPKQKKLMMSCTKDNWNYIEARRQGYKFLVRVH